MKPAATVTRHEDGTFTVSSVCRECACILTLPCHNEYGEQFEPDERALKWADLLLCSRCAAISDERVEGRERDRTLKERIEWAGIPASFHGLSFEDMDRTGDRERAIAAAWAWADAPVDATAGVLLCGPPGTGKTRLAATAVWHRLQSKPVRWCSVAHLIASLQAAFSDSDRKQAVKTLTGNGALVLDDLDKIRPTEWALSQLFVAIDRRVSAGAPLFVTSNAPPGELTEKFGSAVTSRLLGYCRVFTFDGRDRRLTGFTKERA